MIKAAPRRGAVARPAPGSALGGPPGANSIDKAACLRLQEVGSGTVS